MLEEFVKFCKYFKSRMMDHLLGETSDDGIIAIVPREMAFTKTFLEFLQDLGQVPDYDIAYFEKKLAGTDGKLNAYTISEEDRQTDLVVVIHNGSEFTNLKKVDKKELQKARQSALHVFESARNPIHREMEPSSEATDMVERLHRFHKETKSIRLIVLVDGAVHRHPKYDQPENLPDIVTDVWDMERLFRAVASGLSYEPKTIDLVERLGHPLSCISSEKTQDHRCHVTIIPGDLLHDLYEEYGQQLLGLNVRSFLQTRGKVNRGIRETLLNDPGHFLAYNNGISATAEKLKLIKGADGTNAIWKIEGLQIVNGGQTVASIHRAKSVDKIDLSMIRVQTKITEVGREHLHTLVPKISRFSNTQNKVNETDFSAHHPFHITIQELSEQILAPGQTSRWFYERARGEWEVARARLGRAWEERKKFDQQCPRRQKVDKSLLARADNAWSRIPHIVSLGGQKNFAHFMQALDEYGKNWKPDEKYYKELIAKIILLKRVEKIAREIGFSAYRANTVCYTIASLAERVKEKVNLMGIWDHQDIPESLADMLWKWMPLIHEGIKKSAKDLNVTEWCKKEDCWSSIQSLKLKVTPEYKKEMTKVPARSDDGDSAGTNRGQVKKRDAGSGDLVDPREGDPKEIQEGMLDIIDDHGPLPQKTAWRKYIEQSTAQRVTRPVREKLVKAIQVLLSEKKIFSVNEYGKRDKEKLILRLIDAPEVVVRRDDERQLEDIPPSELAHVMLLITKEKGSRSRLNSEQLYRPTINYFGLTRLTAKAETMLDCAWSLYNRFIEQGVMERQAGSKAVYIVKISERGKFRGPLSGSELKEGARSGKLLPAHFISNNDGETWSQASRVRGLEFTAAGK